MNAVEFKNVSFTYQQENSINVLSNVSLEIKQGQFVCILGHNGSGKSTLAKLINCLLLPTSGTVSVLGLDTSNNKNIFEIRKQAGMVFQNPDNQMVATIVEDDIAFGPENIGLSREQIAKNIDFALSATKMENFRYSTSSRLSGGQKQRIAIAGALAINPKILILDESTAMLDPEGRKQVMTVAKELNEKGITVICITHYMDEATLADNIIILDKGNIVMQGKPEEIFCHGDKLKNYSLDVPKATEIALKLYNSGLNINKNIYADKQLEIELCKLLQKT